MVLFKLLVFCWDPEVNESVSKPFKNEISVPYSSLGLLDISPIFFQSQSFRYSFPWCKCQGLYLMWDSNRSLRNYFWDPSRLLIAMLEEEFWWDCVSVSPTYLDMTFLFFYCGRNCFIGSYIFDVSVGGGEWSLFYATTLKCHHLETTCPIIW